MKPQPSGTSFAITLREFPSVKAQKFSHQDPKTRIIKYLVFCDLEPLWQKKMYFQQTTNNPQHASVLYQARFCNREGGAAFHKEKLDVKREKVK